MKNILKSIFIVLLFISGSTAFMQAQDKDKNAIMQKVKDRISIGDCEKAKDNYKIFKDIYGSDNELEKQLANCGKREEVFQAVEQQPQYPGGQAALMQYLSNNLKYPPAAAEQGVQGRVVVQFVVSETGVISNVRVLQSLHPACDKEAIRLISSMPKWIPGKQNGTPVNVYYTIPIRFKLQVVEEQPKKQQ